MKGYTLNIPLAYSAEDGPYSTTKDLYSTVKVDFKNLLFCNQGERVMDPGFGVGINQLLFENYSSQTISLVKERIYSQTKKYMSFISIDRIVIDDSSIDQNKIYFAIEFSVPSIGIKDILEHIIIKS